MIATASGEGQGRALTSTSSAEPAKHGKQGEGSRDSVMTTAKPDEHEIGTG